MHRESEVQTLNSVSCVNSLNNENISYRNATFISDGISLRSAFSKQELEAAHFYIDCILESKFADKSKSQRVRQVSMPLRSIYLHCLCLK